MIIGVPKEIKDREARVGLTPAGARALTAAGHRVLVEAGAGAGSGHPDAAYRAAGGEVVPKAADAWGADLVVKVKEPLPAEYPFLRPGLTLFTYLHLAAVPDLARALLEQKVRAVAYETVQLGDGTLPLLVPMSQIAGRLAVQVGAHYLERPQGGKGVLLGGVPGVAPGRVVILGSGTVGHEAARMALGLGAEVVVLGRNGRQLAQLEERLHGRLSTRVLDPLVLEAEILRADLLIGAVSVPGARTPVLVFRDLVGRMEPGSVIIDVSVDQGGCIETARPTTHTDPVYTEAGVIHYGVPNMPGAVPRTATAALTAATLPYVMKLATQGLERTAREDPALAKGVHLYEGRVAHPEVARALSLPHEPIAW
jgi:alanine dehydrogenase